MNEPGPEKLRGLLPPHESKGLYVRPSHILIGYDDLLAFAAAWEDDVNDVCTINAELNGTIIRQQKRIKAVRDLDWRRFGSTADYRHAILDALRAR